MNEKTTKRMGKRMLAVLLALALSVMMVPATALAADDAKAAASVGAPAVVEGDANAEVNAGVSAEANANVNADMNVNVNIGGNVDGGASVNVGVNGNVAAGANADKANDTNKCVQVKADGAEKSIEVGKVTVENGQPGIDADALNGGKVTVKTGDIISDGGNGITVDATSLGTVTVTTGNVKSATDNGIQASVKGEGDISITTGDISSGANGSGIWTSVDNRDTVKESVITVKAGDVNAQGEGIVIRPFMYGAINVEAGNVKAGDDGVQIIAESGAKVDFKANDIASEKSGMFIYISEGSVINALVTGTLSGKKAPITFFGTSFMSTDMFTLTAWKIDANDGNILMVANPVVEDIQLQAASGNGGLTDAEAAAKAIEQGGFTLAASDATSAFEKSILYIMKLGTAEGATLSATYADGKPLATSHDYSVAKEGERVMLKVDLEEGCELTAAYDGNGNKVELLKGEDGGYYITYTVPKGGGLGLSVEVSAPLAKTAIDEVGNALANATGVATRGVGAGAIVGVGANADAVASGASTIPKTGDGFPVLPFVAITILAAAMLATASIALRKSR